MVGDLYLNIITYPKEKKRIGAQSQGTNPALFTSDFKNNYNFEPKRRTKAIFCSQLTKARSHCKHPKIEGTYTYITANWGMGKFDEQDLRDTSDDI